MTPLTGIGGADENAAVAFATTHWSVVLAAQTESPAAQEALDQLCRSYWLPLYAFIRRDGHSPEEAEDLTQEFFARLLQRRDFDAVRREKGSSLRILSLVSLKHFLSNERHRAGAIKRGRGELPFRSTRFWRTSGANRSRPTI